MNFDTALSDFNSRLFITGMKKMAAQVNFCLFLDVYLPSGLQNGLTLEKKVRPDTELPSQKQWNRLDILSMFF